MRDLETTPPRRTKRADARSSAERGVRKEKEEDFRTPSRVPRSSESYASSRGGYDAPMRIRRLRDRPDFYQDDDMDDEGIADNLSTMLRNCTKLE